MFNERNGRVFECGGTAIYVQCPASGGFNPSILYIDVNEQGHMPSGKMAELKGPINEAYIAFSFIYTPLLL